MLVDIIFERFINEFCGRFIVGFRQEMIDLSLTAGTVAMNDVLMNVTELQGLAPCFTPQLLFVGSLLVDLPLLGRPLKVMVKDVLVLLCADLHELPGEKLRRALSAQVHVAFVLQSMAASAAAAAASGGAVELKPEAVESSLRTLQSLEVMVQRVHVRIEDSGSPADGLSARPAFALGAIISEATVLPEFPDCRVLAAFRNRSGLGGASNGSEKDGDSGKSIATASSNAQAAASGSCRRSSGATGRVSGAGSAEDSVNGIAGSAAIDAAAAAAAASSSLAGSLESGEAEVNKFLSATDVSVYMCRDALFSRDPAAAAVASMRRVLASPPPPALHILRPVSFGAAIRLILSKGAVGLVNEMSLTTVTGPLAVAVTDEQLEMALRWTALLRDQHRRLQALAARPLRLSVGALAPAAAAATESASPVRLAAEAKRAYARALWFFAMSTIRRDLANARRQADDRLLAAADAAAAELAATAAAGAAATMAGAEPAAVASKAGALLAASAAAEAATTPAGAAAGARAAAGGAGTAAVEAARARRWRRRLWEWAACGRYVAIRGLLGDNVGVRQFRDPLGNLHDELRETLLIRDAALPRAPAGSFGGSGSGHGGGGGGYSGGGSGSKPYAPVVPARPRAQSETAGSGASAAGMAGSVGTPPLAGARRLAAAKPGRSRVRGGRSDASREPRPARYLLPAETSRDAVARARRLSHEECCRGTRPDGAGGATPAATAAAALDGPMLQALWALQLELDTTLHKQMAAAARLMAAQRAYWQLQMAQVTSDQLRKAEKLGLATSSPSTPRGSVTGGTSGGGSSSGDGANGADAAAVGVATVTAAPANGFFSDSEGGGGGDGSSSGSTGGGGGEAPLAAADRVGTLLVQVQQATGVTTLLGASPDAFATLTVEESSAAANDLDTARTGRAKYDAKTQRCVWAQTFRFAVELDEAYARAIVARRRGRLTSTPAGVSTDEQPTPQSSFLLLVHLEDKGTFVTDNLGTCTLPGNALTATAKRVCEHTCALFLPPTSKSELFRRSRSDGAAPVQLTLLTAFVPPGEDVAAVEGELASVGSRQAAEQAAADKTKAAAGAASGVLAAGMRMEAAISQELQEAGASLSAVVDTDDLFAPRGTVGVRTVQDIAMERSVPIWRVFAPRSVAINVSVAEVRARLSINTSRALQAIEAAAASSSPGDAAAAAASAAAASAAAADGDCAGEPSLSGRKMTAAIATGAAAVAAAADVAAAAATAANEAAPDATTPLFDVSLAAVEATAAVDAAAGRVECSASVRSVQVADYQGTIRAAGSDLLRLGPFRASVVAMVPHFGGGGCGGAGSASGNGGNAGGDGIGGSGEARRGSNGLVGADTGGMARSRAASVSPIRSRRGTWEDMGGSGGGGNGLGLKAEAEERLERFWHCRRPFSELKWEGGVGCGPYSVRLVPGQVQEATREVWRATRFVAQDVSQRSLWRPTSLLYGTIGDAPAAAAGSGLRGVFLQLQMPATALRLDLETSGIRSSEGGEAGWSGNGDNGAVGSNAAAAGATARGQRAASIQQEQQPQPQPLPARRAAVVARVMELEAELARLRKHLVTPGAVRA